MWNLFFKIKCVIFYDSLLKTSACALMIFFQKQNILNTFIPLQFANDYNFLVFKKMTRHDIFILLLLHLMLWNVMIQMPSFHGGKFKGDSLQKCKRNL